jgi:excisionase family DNA binding protein
MTTYTVNQIAEKLQVHRDTVVNWIRKADLLAFNVAMSGKPRYRITQEALDGFMLRRRAVDGPPPPRERRRKTKLPDGWVDYVEEHNKCTTRSIKSRNSSK